MMTENEQLHKSAQVWTQIESHPCFLRATHVLLYWSMPGEVHTHDFIWHWQDKKRIILPVISGEQLRMVPFEGTASLRKHAHLKLSEPQGNDFPDPQAIELAIVPGIAFDRSLHRLGRGKGYYDRLLPQLRTYNIGVCFDFQLLDEISVEEWDVSMDEVICNFPSHALNPEIYFTTPLFFHRPER